MKSHLTRASVALIAVVIVSVIAVDLADAQRRGRGGGGGGRGAALADVNGLWAMATFDAKLSAESLGKLKAPCQTAYDARKSALASIESGEPSREDRQAVGEKLKGIGDTLAAEAKTALGDEADKLSAWFETRERTIQRMEEFQGGGGSGGRRGGDNEGNSSSS